MKSFFTFIFVVTACIAKSATTINTPNVSGHWTLAGSPYLIQNDISVAGNTMLKIDPGVEVIFQGYFNLKVTGSLRCIGNAATPIVFKMNDTTGWYDDEQINGGWRGIDYQQYIGTAPDSSALQYCVIKDVKYGSPNVIYNYRTLTLWNRNINISHCEFYHNQSYAANADGYIILISNSAGYSVEIDHCSFHHNNHRVAMLRIENYIGQSDYFIHHNMFEQNHGGASLWSVNTKNVIEDNEMKNNISTINFGILTTYDGNNNIHRNKVHHNEIESGGAVNCSGGKCWVEQNLICNNFTTKSSCGLSDGGAGVRLSGNGTLPLDSVVQIVRNNIIANNHCAFYGGGVYLCDTKASVMNNDIINNTAVFGGAAIAGVGLQSKIDIMNNILHGNQGTTGTSNKEITIMSCNQLHIDYNWLKQSYSATTYMSLGSIAGDTSHNIIATNPMLSNPTTSAGVSADATTKDFNLTSNSVTCIDKGDTTGAFCASIDYLFNTRIVGNNVDIGAFEWQDKAEGIEELKQPFATFYPNPVKDELQFQFESNERYVVKVFDITSHLISQQIFNTNRASIQLKDIPSGVYFITIMNQQGRYQSGKILKAD